jgi:hypothetical protein
MARPPPKPATAGRAGASDADAVARLRALCLAMPEAVEKISHGEPTWFAGTGKVFAMLDDHHHGSPHLAVWLPLPLGAQESLIAEDPRRYFRPPYVGSSGWVALVLDRRPSWAEVARRVREAYLHVAARRLAAVALRPALPTPGRRPERRSAPTR